MLPQAKGVCVRHCVSPVKINPTLAMHHIKEAQQDQVNDPETKANRFDLLDIQFALC
jgi:hypothetical protein